MGYLESVQALDSEVRRYADMRAELEASGDTAAIELATKRLAAAVKLLCEENTPLAGPLPKDKILAAKDGIVSGIVELESSAIIGHDMEDVNDLASEELVDSTLLMDISYELIGALDSNTILMRVTGDASMVQDDLDDEDEDY